MSIVDSQNIYTQKTQGQYMTGARCVIKINGKIAAFANAINWQISTYYRPLYVLDQVLPTELMPTIVAVRGQIGGFIVPGMALSALHLQANPETFLLHKYITIEARDSVTDVLLIKVDRAVITDRTETHSAQALSQMTFNWEAIGWSEEGNSGKNYITGNLQK